LLVVGFLGGDDRGVRGKHKVDTRVRHKVGLELSNIDVEGTVEAKRGSEGGDDLGDKSVKVGVGRSLDIKRSSADVVKSFVIQTEGTVGVLKESVGGEHVVVWLDYGGSDLRSRGDGERKLGFSAVVDGKSLKEKGTKTRSSSSTSGVEDEETLKSGTVISELSDTIKDKIDNFFANGIVTTSVVVGGILFSRDQLLRVVQLTVGAGSDFIERSRLKIDEHCARDVFSSSSFREKGVEGIVTTTDGFVGRHLTIRLDSMLKAVKLPTAVTHLNSGLTNM